jgi:hypothetical protein
MQNALWAAPEEAGYLWKLGLNHVWAKRWMVLCGRSLFYFQNEKVHPTHPAPSLALCSTKLLNGAGRATGHHLQASKALGAEPTGVIRLDGATISLDHTHDPYAFVGEQPSL